MNRERFSSNKRKMNRNNIEETLQKMMKKIAANWAIVAETETTDPGAKTKKKRRKKNEN